MNTRTVAGGLEVALGLAIVFLAIGRSAVVTIPAAVEILSLALFLVLVAAHATHLALVAKPEPMSRRTVIIGGVLLIVPTGILVLFYGPSNPLIAVFGAVVIGELYRQLFISIEPREDETE